MPLQRVLLGGDAISFRIPFGLDDIALSRRLVHRGLGACDQPDGEVRVLQLGGRTLPVPVARFAERPRLAFGGPDAPVGAGAAA